MNWIAYRHRTITTLPFWNVTGGNSSWLGQPSEVNIRPNAFTEPCDRMPWNNGPRCNPSHTQTSDLPDFIIVATPRIRGSSLTSADTHSEKTVRYLGTRWRARFVFSSTEWRRPAIRLINDLKRSDLKEHSRPCVTVTPGLHGYWDCR